MNEHDRMAELAPWYANGTLGTDERERFERHLESCSDCRRAVDQCRDLARSYPAADGPAPHPARVARLLERIDSGGGEALGPPRPKRGRFGRLLRSTPRPVRWLVAVQAAVLVVAAASALLSGERAASSGAPFRTLSAAAARESGDLRVVFVPEAGERDIRRLLLGARAEIVGGPTPVGAYTIELDASPAGASVGEALELLRASALVRLAEPIGAGRAASR
jgi:anti-sigma-K factor RskA